MCEKENMRPEEINTAELIDPLGSRPKSPFVSSVSVEVDLAAQSHRGRVRLNNEDHFYVGRASRDLQTLMTSLPVTEIPERSGEVVYAMIVADGMGGQAAGEIASQMAIGTMIQLVLATADWIMRPDPGEPERVMERIADRYRKAHAAVLHRSEEDPSLAGMGTTMTLACSLGHRLLTAHVGDSRAYLFRNGVLQQLTRDHTLAQRLADAGLIDSEHISEHRARHILTEAIGAGQQAEPDLRQIDLVDGDDILLCTDGLTGMIGDDAIADILQRRKRANEACQLLIDAALERGGTDNVTVTLARYHIPRNA